MDFLQTFRTIAVIGLVPILLITTSVRLVVNFTGFYSFEFERSRIAEYTGIDNQELLRISGLIQDYFHNENELLIIPSKINGRSVENIFNEKEVHHMKDVKELFKGVFFLQSVSLILLSLLIASQILFHRTKGLISIMNNIVWGAYSTLFIILLVSLAVLLSFDRIFRLFHVLSFANDFWMLNPRYDYLVAIFNQQFFFHACLLVGIFSLVGAFLLIACKHFLNYFMKRTRSVTDEN